MTGRNDASAFVLHTRGSCAVIAMPRAKWLTSVASPMMNRTVKKFPTDCQMHDHNGNAHAVLRRAADWTLVLLHALRRQASPLRYDPRCGLTGLTPDAPERSCIYVGGNNRRYRRHYRLASDTGGLVVAVKGRFIEPMLLLRTDALPSDPSRWTYQLKLDGYRAIAYKLSGKLYLRSRNDNDFAARYPSVARGLVGLPDDTVIDGEIVAFNEEGRPSFNALQNQGLSAGPVVFYVFDVMVLRGKDVMSEPLERRQALLEKSVLPKLKEPVRYAGALDAPLPDLIASVKTHGLEGLVAKRRGSRYEPGMRSGAWMKMRVSRGQEFVIGGYTLGTKTFDAIVFGYYEGRKLIYAARTRNGFTPATRLALYKRFAGLEIPDCPFANLPEARSGRWGQGLTKAKMAECRWLKPELVAQIEFLEWTADNHLRHSRFVGLRDDKRARDVTREEPPDR
jgi:DNA ligase D-like protein (predicted ligase)